jgi:hypothetical protein
MAKTRDDAERKRRHVGSRHQGDPENYENHLLQGRDPRGKDGRKTSKGDTPPHSQMRLENVLALKGAGLHGAEYDVALTIWAEWLKTRRWTKLKAKDVAARAGAGEATFWRTVGKLRDVGLLLVDSGSGRRTANKYWPVFGAVDAPPARGTVRADSYLNDRKRLTDPDGPETPATPRAKKPITHERSRSITGERSNTARSITGDRSYARVSTVDEECHWCSVDSESLSLSLATEDSDLSTSSARQTYRQDLCDTGHTDGPPPPPPDPDLASGQPSTRMPESTLRQQQLENEEKAARLAARNEDQRKSDNERS